MDEIKKEIKLVVEKVIGLYLNKKMLCKVIETK